MPKIQFSKPPYFLLFHYEEALKMILNSRTSTKMFLSESVIFWGLRLSLGHFGQQTPESPVSTPSALPLFIMDFLTFKDYPRSNSFFSMGILEGVKWQTSQADYNGTKQLCFRIKKKCLFWPNNSFFLFLCSHRDLQFPILESNIYNWLGCSNE